MKLKKFSGPRFSGAKAVRRPAVTEVLEHRRLLATIGFYDIQFGEGSGGQDKFYNPAAGQHEGLVHTFVRLDDLANTDFTQFDAIIIHHSNSLTARYKVNVGLESGKYNENNPDEFIEALDRPEVAGGFKSLKAAVAGGVDLLIHDRTVNPADTTQTLTNEVLPGNHDLGFGRDDPDATNQAVNFADPDLFPELQNDALDGYLPLYGSWANSPLPESHHVLVTGEGAGAGRVTAFAYDYGDGRVTFSSVLPVSSGSSMPAALRPKLTTFEKNLTIFAVGYGSSMPSNTAPVASLAAPAAIDEGQGLFLDASGSSDGEGDTLSYEWSVNAQPITANSAAVSLSWGDLADLGIDGSTTSFEVGLTVSDGELASSQTATITVDNVAPAIVGAPTALAAQYSDALAGLSFSATDVGGDTLTAAIVSDGGLGVAGLTEVDGVWSATPVIDVPAGEYEVVLGVSDGTAQTTHTVLVTVAHEDATVLYTGLQHFTFAPNAVSPTVRLWAAISDASVTDMADAESGDITRAQVRFFDMDDPEKTLAVVNVTPATIDMTDAVIGYATADVLVADLNLPTTRVGVEVMGDYYNGDLAEGALVTVSFSTAGRVSGGGRMNLSTDAILRSAGVYTGDAGSELQYGFSGRYRQNTGSYEGEFEATFYSDGRLYRLISTSVDSLSTYNSTDGTVRANMAVTATLYEVTGKKTQTPVETGLQVDLTMTDGKQSSLVDSLGLTVWSPTGSLQFSSLWDGMTTLEQELSRGNPIKVWE